MQTITVAPGDEIANGAEIARINGIQRLTMLTAEPLYRPLSIDATGNDVAALNTFLESQGFPANDADVFGGATAAGVRKYSEAIGVSPATDIFDPGWVLFLNEPITAESITLTTGAPAPVAGEEIVTAVPRLQGASFVSAPSANRLIDADSNTPAPAADTITVGEGASVSLGETTLQLAEGLEGLSPEGIQALAPQLHTLSPATLATLTEELPSDTWMIPASSVFLDTSGKACVVAQNSGDPFSIGVTILRATESDVLVEGLLKAGYQVALDPKLERATCK